MLSLAISCNAIALHCRFETIRYNSNEIYACTATALIETRIESVTAIFGTHQTGKGNGDVLGLTIISQNMGFFPRNIEEFFPNVAVIDFSNNSISSISNQNLIPFPNLRHLGVASNRISSLDSNLFSGLNSLRFILLSDNAINSLDSNLFAGLNSGSFIDLSNNTIRHVGHNFILPKQSDIWLDNNICVDATFHTFSDDVVEDLTFDLLKKCPPTISLIESTLESRDNFIKDLLNRVKVLEAKIENLTLQ